MHYSPESLKSEEMLAVEITENDHQHASTRWSHVCLLSTRNHAFAKIIAQVIRLRAQNPEHQIQSIRMDNAAEFSSKAFNDYCMALGIQVQHTVPYVHTQNGLAESLIKRIKLIARPLLQNCNLPTSYWGSCSLTRCRLNSIATNCISHSLSYAISTWEYTKYFSSAKIRLRSIRTDLTT